MANRDTEEKQYTYDFERSDEYNKLRYCLMHIDATESSIIRAHFMAGMTIACIARLLRKSKRYVNGVKVAGLRNLRRMLIQNGVDQ